MSIIKVDYGNIDSGRDIDWNNPVWENSPWTSGTSFTAQTISNLDLSDCNAVVIKFHPSFYNNANTPWWQFGIIQKNVTSGIET